MTNEQINLAAIEYASKRRKGVSTYSFDIFGRCDIKQAFGDGANWRINAVWHDASEEPEIKKPYIYELDFGDTSAYDIDVFYVKCTTVPLKWTNRSLN